MTTFAINGSVAAVKDMYKIRAAGKVFFASANSSHKPLAFQADRSDPCYDRAERGHNEKDHDNFYYRRTKQHHSVWFQRGRHRCNRYPVRERHKPEVARRTCQGLGSGAPGSCLEQPAWRSAGELQEREGCRQPHIWESIQSLAPAPPIAVLTEPKVDKTAKRGARVAKGVSVK
jgi:hypothetical protein